MSQSPDSDSDPQALSDLLDCAWTAARSRQAAQESQAPARRRAAPPAATALRTYDHTADAEELLQAGWSEQQVIGLSPNAIIIERHPTTGQMTCIATNREARNRIDAAVQRVQERAQTNSDLAVLDAAAQAMLVPGQRLCTQRQINYITLLQARSLRAGGETSSTTGANTLTLEQLRALTIEQASTVIASLIGDC